MNKTFENKTGIALVVFAILLVLTMVLHPAGGSVEHLVRITPQIIITHAVAIFSLPFGLLGFWGLTRYLGKDRFWSMLAFSTMVIGIIAVLMAASANGLVMPLFLQSHNGSDAATIESLKPILRYSFSINKAFDFIYTGAFAFAIVGWSICILHTNKLSKWLGWLGVVVALAAVFITGSSLGAHSLTGFRLFVGSLVLWILLTGIALARTRQVDTHS